MTIDQEFNCIGYFGFGNGVSMARKQGNAFCNGCTMGKACWEAHRARCKQMFPDLCAHIDELGKQPNGQKLIMEFIKKHKTEPYMTMMMGNLEDGMFVVSTGKPKDRGDATLKYPFEL